MSIFAIFAVRIDERSGQIDAVKWKQFNPLTATFTMPLREIPVIEVVDAIHRGDDVFTTFTSEGTMVAGRRVKTVVPPGGTESIETAMDEQGNGGGRTLIY